MNNPKIVVPPETKTDFSIGNDKTTFWGSVTVKDGKATLEIVVLNSAQKIKLETIDEGPA